MRSASMRRCVILRERDAFDEWSFTSAVIHVLTHCLRALHRLLRRISSCASWRRAWARLRVCLAKATSEPARWRFWRRLRECTRARNAAQSRCAPVSACSAARGQPRVRRRQWRKTCCFVGREKVKQVSCRTARLIYKSYIWILYILYIKCHMIASLYVAKRV